MYFDLLPEYVCEKCKCSNSICQLILLCPSKFNLKNNNIIPGYIFDMFIESDRFDCYMTSQTDNAATSSLYGTTSNVLSDNYRHLPSVRQCVVPPIESIKTYKQLFCLNSLK